VIEVGLRTGSDAERTLLSRLWQLYLHDLSAYEATAPGPDGLFDPGPYFDRYWSEDDRHPLLIEADGRVVGFALVRRLDDDTHEMAEFFVLRGERRRGIGRAAARAVFERFPGRWRVAQMRDNVPSHAFWRTVVAEVTGGNYVEVDTDSPPGGRMQVFSSSIRAHRRSR
jgi:predicted acetyltransferase